MLQISAGFQQVKIGERGGRRRDFHDSGVHTRQLMEHVKESKSGNTKMLMSIFALLEMSGLGIGTGFLILVCLIISTWL